MADTITECDLDLLFRTMETTIAAAFPTLRLVAFDHEERERLDLPCCLLDCAEMDTDNDAADPGTEQQAMTARFEARLVLGFRTPHAKQEARLAATAFAAFLRKQLRWSPARSGPARVIGCYRDEFDPRLDQYEVWRIEWTHVLHFGKSVWEGQGVTPTQIYLGYAPDVGPENIDKYKLIAGAQ